MYNVLRDSMLKAVTNFYMASAEYQDSAVTLKIFQS